MSKQAQATSKPATRKAPAKGGALAQAAQVLAQAPAAPAQAPAAPARATVVTGEKGQRLLCIAGLVENANAAANVLARAATLCKPLPSEKATKALRLGKPCRVRVPYTIACYERIVALLAANGGTAPAEKLAAVATTDFVVYAVRRGWLVGA